MRRALERTLRRIWAGRRHRTLAVHERLLYWLLIPPSILYSSLMWGRRACYRLGLLRSRRAAGAVVVSVGNITVGGTGKTPLAIGLARGLLERDVAVAVVSRGHGGTGRGAGPLLVSDGSGPLVTPARAGDEPVMIARSVPVPVIVSRDRWTGARLAVSNYGARVVILDDGFQHRGLERDADILLLDASDPFGNRWTLPAGRLREPISALSDADLFFFVHRGHEGALPIPDRMRALLAAFNRQAILVTGTLSIQAVRDAGSGRLDPPGWLNGRRVLLVSGLADPGPFQQEVAGRGAAVAGHQVFPDHHPYTGADLVGICEEASRLEVEAVLTTAKDEVKIMALGLPEEGPEFRVAELGYDPRSVDVIVEAVAGMGDG